MAALVGEIRNQEESALSFKPGGSHIQIDSISIEISSGEVNGAGKECKHFSIRGFVLEQRKKDIRLCSPFVSDGDLDNSSVTSLDLPPLDVHKFKWWRCGGCLQDCNSSQGTSKEIANRKSIITQNSSLQETGSSKGLSKLFAKAAGNGFTNGSFTCQRSANSRGASFLKSISEAVVVPFKGLDFDKALPSRKSDKVRGMSKVVMGPPSGLANDKTKEHNVPKSAASSQGTSNGFSMPPPGGFPKSRSGKSISACKQQNAQIPKPNVRIWQKGETSTAGTLHKKRNYAKRSVQQSDNAGDELEIYKADENSSANNSNREALQHNVPKEGDVRIPDIFNDEQAAPEFDLDKSEEVGSSNKFIEKLSNHSTAGRPTDPDQSSLPECSQFNSVHPLVESNRLLKRPRIEFEEGRNKMYEEEEEEDYRGLHLRRVPKIRLLSDVIAKYPTRVQEQPENISAKSSEQTKRPASPVLSHDTSAERVVSDKPGQQLTKSVSGSWKKRRTLQDNEEHLADSSNGGAKRSDVLFAEPENRTEVEKKSKKTTVSTPFHGAMDNSNKQAFYPDKEERIGFGQKKHFPQIGEDYQPATKFLQFGPDNVENARGEGTSDYIVIGSGFKRRSAAVENYENASTPSSTMTDYLRTSVSSENELWISRVQAGGTVVEHKGGEGSSCTQQKGIKGPVKDIDINSIPVDDKTSEPGTADDIPMDIVELLAKHQHERRCDTNIEKHINVLELNGEKNTTQKPYPTMLKPQASYSRNGFGRQFEPVAASASAKQNLPGNLFNQTRTDDPFCARFSGYTQSQGQVPGGAQYSSSIGSTAKSWNGNMPSFRPTSRAILQPVQSFNRYPGPPSAQIWPPLGMYTHPQGSPMLQKGEASQGTISFNIGNPNPSFLSPKMMRRPVDLASNETIPAMQLLNLVQVAGTRPTTPNTDFIRKLPFQNPDNHHRQYNNPGLRFDPYSNPSPFSRHPLCPCSSASPTPQIFVSSTPFSPPLVRNLSSDKRRNAVHQQHPLRAPFANIVRKTEVCMINRNPAEISDLKEMRRFMLGPEDLIRGKPRIATIPKARGRPRLHKT